MTYLDLSEKLKENVKDQNLQVKPLQVKHEVEINTKGQMIYQNDQLFDKNACLIDKQSKIKQRQASKENHENTTHYTSTQYLSVRSSNGKKASISRLKLSLSPGSRTQNISNSSLRPVFKCISKGIDSSNNHQNSTYASYKNSPKYSEKENGFLPVKKSMEK
jgi:hypothetical protein